MSVRRSPPAWPYVLLLAAWLGITVALARGDQSSLRTAGGGGAAEVLMAIGLLAESIGAFYLLGFVAKSVAYLTAPNRRNRPPASETPSLVVLYLTAGDFDPHAVDSLLRLRSAGPKRFVVHDDGDDAVARAHIESFLNQHPCRSEWETLVLHRPARIGGKAGAVNWVLARLEPEWEVMLFCDSDSIALEPRAFLQAAAEFEDPNIAVVQFRNRGVARPTESTLLERLACAIDVFDVFATPQARWGYVPFFGHNALVRIADLRRLGGLTQGFFSDDLDYSVRLTLTGRRIAYRADVVFGERHPADWQAFRMRARKWALGCMQVARARGLQVVFTPGIPLAHRIGLLEFMGFYPAQALLVCGLMIHHLLLPWIAPVGSAPLALAAGTLVTLALFSPTLAWSIRERRMAEWPTLAWLCALVYGGSVLATVRGVLDGLSTKERPWVPTNLTQSRSAVPLQGWLDAVVGLGLLLVPWIAGSALMASPASYVFAGVLLFAPLTFVSYREPRPAASRGLTTAAVVAAGLVLWVGAASAATRATVHGDRLLVNGASFEVRGVHYSPWTPGTGPGGHGQYPGAQLVDRDLHNLRALGANTLFMHSAPLWALMHASRDGFHVIYMFNIAWNDTSEAAFDRQQAGIVAELDSLRSCDGVLAWILGNEVPSWVVDRLGAPTVAGRIARLAAAVRRRDPGRLLGHANWPPTKQLDLSFLDLACFNLYPAWPYEVSVKGFGPYLREVIAPLARGRPLLLTEFGINSLEAGESRQADVLKACWREIEHSSAVGGVVFEWSDEWWKNYDNPLPGKGYWERGYAPNDAETHDADPEEYYGIVRADRSPKPAYAAVREMWSARGPTPAWLPWALLCALLIASWAALGMARRPRRRRVEAGASAVLVVICSCGVLEVPTARAQSTSWSQRDSLFGEATGDQFGWAVAGVGDLDGDGIGDVGIGAHFHTVVYVVNCDGTRTA